MITAKRERGSLPRAFAVVRSDMPDPEGVTLVGRVERFDLGVPLAVRIGAEVVIVSAALVDAERGWDAVRNVAGNPGTEVWVVADDDGRSRHEWVPLARRILDERGRQRGTATTALPMALDGGPQTAVPPVIAILGAKGGVGKTFVAANLVHYLAGKGHAVAAADLDAAAGDLAVRLGLPAVMDLAVCLQAGATMDFQPSAKRGYPVSLWAAPPRPEFAAALNDQVVERILAGAANLGAACLVFDTPMHHDSCAVLAAIEHASTIVLVTTLSPSAARHCKVTVELLKRLNIDVRRRLVLLVNRASRRATVEQATFRDVLGQPPHVVIPDLGAAADVDCFSGCPAIGARAGRRMVEPVSRLAELVVPELNRANHAAESVSARRRGLIPAFLVRARRRNGGDYWS